MCLTFYPWGFSPGCAAPDGNHDARSCTWSVRVNTTDLCHPLCKACLSRSGALPAGFQGLMMSFVPVSGRASPAVPVDPPRFPCLTPAAAVAMAARETAALRAASTRAPSGLPPSLVAVAASAAPSPSRWWLRAGARVGVRSHGVSSNESTYDTTPAAVAPHPRPYTVC